MKQVGVEVGDIVPFFELEDQFGELFNLTQVFGKKQLVLFFYPKDFTPGCIKEVCSFRDQYEIFTSNNVEVIGVSSDLTKSHQKFAKKYKLPFKILSDPKGKTRKLLGVTNSLFGLLPGRVTFIIDINGIVLMRFSNQFGAEKHLQESLKTLGLE